MLKNITAWLCGWVETRDIIGPQTEHVVWDTTPTHYIMDKKGNERTASAGKSLMQGNILYNGRKIDGIGPQWTEIVTRTRRQNPSSSVEGLDSKSTAGFNLHWIQP